LHGAFEPGAGAYIREVGLRPDIVLPVHFIKNEVVYSTLQEKWACLSGHGNRFNGNRYAPIYEKPGDFLEKCAGNMKFSANVYEVTMELPWSYHALKAELL
jgi:hypothetical protein